MTECRDGDDVVVMMMMMMCLWCVHMHRYAYRTQVGQMV
jgi:hypothetical protein